MKGAYKKGLTLVSAGLLAVSLTGCMHTQSQGDAMSSQQAVADNQGVNTITVSDIEAAQKQWAQGLVSIGEAYTNKGNYQQTASDLIDKLYAFNYERGVVLFKPTKAVEEPFRRSHQSALSYFVGGDKYYPEDKGFALAPWVNIKFNNDAIYVHGDVAVVMGQYTFTNSKNDQAEVEYTLGYVKTDDGDLKIFAQHSSLPFQAN
ncbi:hypothetical protein OAO18_04475 [Francisellaceae bacterium]|nr:hypothetical protein [Francisellaceae bacterium]